MFGDIGRMCMRAIFYLRFGRELRTSNGRLLALQVGPDDAIRFDRETIARTIPQG
jgi:hypothetical protein